MSSIQLKLASIKNIPFQCYDKDFVFIVNGKEFKTSRFVSDLLSPYISKIHANDPSFDIFTINTKNSGDFTHILNLVDFNTNQYPESEFSFILEVLGLLGNSTNEIELQNEKEGMGTITPENVFTLMKNPQFSNVSKSDLISFISSHFTELLEDHKEDLSNLNVDTLFEIISQEDLIIESEDQLLNFINELYSQNSKYSILYENVNFTNLSKKAIGEFISIYDINDITAETWRKLSKCLSEKVEKKNTFSSTCKRYKCKYPQLFTCEDKNRFDGIINFLLKQSKDQNEKEIDITSSSINNNDERYHPRVVTEYENPGSYFYSMNNPNEWICFDFKEHRVVPTNYKIRSFPNSSNFGHPKSWVIEGSNDNSSYEIISEEKDNSSLNGKSVVCTFTINKQQKKEYKYIRMRLTGPNWFNKNGFLISSFEIYGKLI